MTRALDRSRRRARLGQDTALQSSFQMPGAVAGPTEMSLNDCAAICVLDRDDIEAMDACGPIPDLAGQTLEDYFAAGGTSTAIRILLVEDIRAALDKGIVHHAAELVAALSRFLEENPQARPDLSIH